MTTDQDHYLVLGVDPSASARQITHAYRTLIRRHHPDTRTPARHPTQPNLNQDCDHDHDVALRHVVAAYTVLHDPRQRADYDTHRAERARRDQRPLAHEDPEPARQAHRPTGLPRRGS